MVSQVQGLGQGKMVKSEAENAKSRASDVRNGQRCPGRDVILGYLVTWLILCFSR